MTGNSIVADTNIFIDLMKGDAAIAAKLESFAVVYLSPVTLAELYFGAYRSVNVAKHLKSVAIATQNTNLLPIDASTAEQFVSIKLSLFAQGRPIPENDIWIAAAALQFQLPLYTSDKHFSYINGLNLI